MRRTWIAIRDDGGGIPVGENSRIAPAKMGLDESLLAARPPPRNLLSLISLNPASAPPGEVTDLSGRGIGMDVGAPAA